jgi:hypothetical protein
MQEGASESKLSGIQKNQLLRPSFKNTASPGIGFRDISGLISEDPNETKNDSN